LKDQKLVNPRKGAVKDLLLAKKEKGPLALRLGEAVAGQFPRLLETRLVVRQLA
jgi:hypothetical protein